MIKLLLRFLKGSAIICAIIAPIMMILEVFMDLLQPTLLANIIDIGLVNNDTTYILTVGKKMLIVAILGLIGGSGCSVFTSIASMKLGQNLRTGLFNKIQTLSYADIDHLKPSSLITRLTNDVMQIQNMVTMLLRGMIRSPLLCIGGLIMSYILSPMLSIIFLIAIPIILISVVIVMKKSFPLFLAVQQKIDNINVVMRENILGVQVIKVFNIVNKQFNRFNDANNGLNSESIKAQNINMMLWPIVSLVMNFAVISVLWFGGIMVNRGLIQVGIIMAFINYIIQIMNDLIMAVGIVINISRAKASADRINEIFDIVPAINNNDGTIKPEKYDVEFKNVSFKYNEDSDYVLKNISFQVKEGEKIGIIGGTGAGKSTLVSLISRLYDATEGQILIGGVNVKDLNLAELRKNIGFVTQENTLFSGTIERNLKFGSAEADRDLVEESVKEAEAYEFIMKKENAYESSVEQRGQNFSGGPKQRLCIARVLIRNCKIFIMDDSTSALDMATEAKLQNPIKKRMKNKTMFVIAQRISAIADADKIIVLDNGTINAIGKHDDLIKNNEIYRSIAILQFGEDVIKVG
ncbi:MULTISPECIES: ABC transporter ATP-binding protein [Clostridium]|uniref:ABC transporter ATP-binding protein n=1 Tax=Clostridium carnis TaxID=1530 RepID=A0ABY6STF3_9CLOT|nr:ABC transporter ATP-binding protein [Clostridium carnis]CAI3711168.1 putative ABC transporter, ATPase/permease components [Clostridium neonatale]CAI3713755.1 putative ABC transporter, ATPase/permease components [Clostridium neonatale]CAI3721378.1 putative ABC transporter, ATPase/permease components [Clostridium neonatale]CAI3726840.1 putative ABC transporter, ATPase/permease components [Clostridium neonatale]VDG71699.1 ABC transporter ATP-binding protein [Clostridium carnis]